jgi:hypothetical protein
VQKDAGIELLPVGDFAGYDQVSPLSTDDQPFAQAWEQLFEEVIEAKALGHAVKPVVIGPLTCLWLSKNPEADLDELALERLLPVYDQALNRLAALGSNGYRSMSRSWPRNCRRTGKRSRARLQHPSTCAAEEVDRHLFRCPGRQPGLAVNLP